MKAIVSLWKGNLNVWLTYSCIVPSPGRVNEVFLGMFDGINSAYNVVRCLQMSEEIATGVIDYVQV